jgi:pimeloyl-ACP methyl ester carboxylesterase
MYQAPLRYRLFAMLLIIFGAALASLLPSAAQPTTAQPQPSTTLTPCKLDIGLGAAKQQIDAQCGIVSVPEDRVQASNGLLIDIHVTVLPATNRESTAAPIFHFEGGPGGSAITNFTAWYTSYRPLMADHDIVLIDQRGTGKSASLQCSEVIDPALKDLAEVRTREQELTLLLERTAACLQRVAATNDPALYHSVTMADDTDAVRKALGYDKINLFGNSYGTWLAQIYLRRHESNVNAVILDSVAGPWNHYLLSVPENAEAALTRVFDLCAQDAACNARYPNLSEKFDKALADLATKPQRASGQGLTGAAYIVMMTRERLLEAFRTMLYSSAYIGILPQAVEQAANGVYIYPATTLVAAAEQGKDISFGLFYSVHCAETLPFYTPALIGRYQPTQFYGSAQDGVAELQQICANWRGGELEAADVAPVTSSKPVLILSGAFDPVTPVSFGEEAAARFPNGTLVLFPYQAHGLMPASKCAQNLVKAFLTAPDQPLDASCTAKDIAPVFSGTFKVELQPFSDPAVSVKLNVPKGWTWQADKSSAEMAFFASADQVHLLGAARLRAKNTAEAQAIAVKAIEAAYGAVDPQATIDILGSRIVQHGLDNPDNVYLGVLTIVGFGNDYRVLWYAAPTTVFTATFETVVPVLLSIN